MTIAESSAEVIAAVADPSTTTLALNPIGSPFVLSGVTVSRTLLVGVWGDGALLDAAAAATTTVTINATGARLLIVDAGGDVTFRGLRLDACTLSGSYAVQSGGAIAAAGGAIVTLSDSTVLRCQARFGGGISLQWATLMLSSVAVEECAATESGGGLHVAVADSGGSVVTATSSAFRANTVGDSDCAESSGSAVALGLALGPYLRAMQAHADI